MNIIPRIHALEACTSSGEVAALLEENAAKGERGSRDACPIACYLGRAPDARNISATADFLYWTPVIDGKRQEALMRNATEPISDFIVVFDKGIYPHLVD